MENVAGYDMSYDELDVFCREAWEDDYYIHLHFDGFEKQKQTEYCKRNESRTGI